MLKFIVVIYKRPDLTQEQFRQHLQGTHATVAKSLPGLRKYVQNYVCADPKRKSPGWDAVVELYFGDWSSMERRGQVRKVRLQTPTCRFSRT